MAGEAEALTRARESAHKSERASESEREIFMAIQNCIRWKERHMEKDRDR